MKKRKYYPHNWTAVHNLDDESLKIISENWSVEELIEAKTINYELPSSIFCIIRATNQDTLKVKEYVYQLKSAANKRLQILNLSDEPMEIALITDDTYVVMQNEACAAFPF
jgi:hypothetical protein